MTDEPNTAVVTAFWQKVEQRSGDECWPWQGHRDRKGYGLLIIRRRKLRATRLSLAIAGKPRPAGLFALHACDNPPCCNPAHLRWGTHRDNARDTIERGQHAKAAQTHCVHGHELAGDNLKIRYDGYRACRECIRTAQRISSAKRRQRQREAANG